MRWSSIEELATDRLSLRPLRMEDAEEMVSVLADAELYRYTGGSPPELAALGERYRHQVAGPSDGSEIWHNWIARTDEGVAVGFVQATIEGPVTEPVDDSTSNAASQAGDGIVAETAWLIGVDHQGKGYASEAVRAVCRWLVASGASTLTAHIHPEHRASQGVANAVGLRRTGEVDDDGEEVWLSRH